MAKETSTDQKALSLNLDASVYGTIAEIGAGQEVARRFFSVGASSGTIAKTMSAYDMKFSDEIYGEVPRYVSRERVEGMLKHEFNLILERLSEQRGTTSRFFAFADTVSARNFQGTNECHGWMGIRFQADANEKPNDIILHVRMLDSANILQQEALGILGINIIYGAYNYTDEPNEFINSLSDELGTERIEIDLIHLEGPNFEEQDLRKLNLQLLHRGLTNAVLFDSNFQVQQPSSVLRKRPILIQRGSFRPVTKVNIDMFKTAEAQFAKDVEGSKKDQLSVFEMTLKNLTAHNFRDDSDIIAVTESLASLGFHVMITDYPEFYRLSSYIRRYSKEPLGILMGANNLSYIFDEKYYDNLAGGILEAFGRLFKEKVSLFVYPIEKNAFLDFLAARGMDEMAKEQIDDEILTAENLRVKHDLRLLYRYLRERGYIKALDGFDRELLSIHSSVVRKKIAKGDPSWKNDVPNEAVAIIQENNLFHKGHSLWLKSNLT